MNQISVAIPVYNGMTFLPDLLRVLLSQKNINLEILICDSSSADGSWEYINNFKDIKSFRIPKHEFSHGATRQKLVEMASSKVIIFLSQDALPISDYWAYDHFVAHSISPRTVGAILGNQIPRKFAHAAIAQRINRTFRSLGNQYGVTTFGSDEITLRNFGKQPLAFLSDVHVSYKQEILMSKVPFQNVAYAEDQLMARDLIQADFQIAYFPQISVEHSNDISAINYRERIFEETVGLSTVLKVRVEEIKFLRGLEEFALNLAHDYLHLLRKLNRQNLFFTLKEFILSPIFEIQNIRGINSAARNLKSLDTYN